MGLQEKGLRYVFGMLNVCDISKPNPIRICELGNTKLVSNSYNFQMNTFGAAFSVAKALFTYLEFDDVSIDINGKDSAIKLDLNEPINPDLIGGRFDIVLNAGTTEHIEDQYMVFKNIHNLCALKGTMIHIVPLEGTHHGLYRYTKEFFVEMSKLCKWEMVDYTISDPSYGTPRQEYIFCTMRYGISKKKIITDGKKKIVRVYKEVDYVSGREFPFQHLRGLIYETYG